MTSQHPDRKPIADPPRTPRTVRVTCAPQDDGRVAVSVSVNPLEDLDAAGGVFVDVLLAGSDRAMRRAEVARAPVQTGLRSRRTFTSHLIAAGRQIARGGHETYRSEIVLTEASPTGLSWFVRGRFATLGADDLRSAWVRVDDARRIA